MQDPEEVSACECVSCQAADFTTIGNLKSIEVIHSKLKNWDKVDFDKVFLKNNRDPETLILVLTVEFENGSKEIYIADTVVYEINGNGKTVDTYYP